MAPSTPPPPSSVRLAALTMASTSSVVMSATQISSRVVAISAVRRGAFITADASANRVLGAAPQGRPVSTLRHQFRLGLRRVIDGAAAADVIEMRIEEAPGRALAELAQRLEIFVVGVQRAARGDRLVQVLHHDAMKPQAAEFAATQSLRQSPLVDEPVDEGDAAQLGEKRGVEAD